VLAVVDDPGRALGDRLPRVSPESLLSEAPAGADVAPPLALDAADDSDVAMIGYTSGTTGRPKGAVLEHRSLRAGAEALVEAWGWTPDDRLVHALPMFHMHGLGAAANGTLSAGASMVVLPRFDPAAVVDAVAAYDATLFFGVPTMYARLRDAGRLRDLAGLRLLVSGSAPLDPALFRAIEAETGQPPIERYGMSETVMLTSNPLRGERRAGSVGLPLPGVAVRLGAEGALEVTGPNVFASYWERPEATREAFTADGWFRTGDVGELDDDGYLRLVGRASDLIITGGYNVYPREVEETLYSHPDVAEAAVVGVPDDRLGEEVLAFVALKADAHVTAIDLVSYCRDRLAAYKYPRIIDLRAELPKNSTGKILKLDLRAGLTVSGIPPRT
jgi:malonyl-CoA/methylmalonyl-CoA synthetase